jgi:hypothetical protein
VNARQVDEATTRLHELRIESVGDLALAVVASGLAMAATQLRPALAIPFLLGAFGVGFLGIRAFVRRTFLVEDLAGDRDAYAIPDVRRFGRRVAMPAHRHELARSIRVATTESCCETGERIQAARGELDQLAALLEDDRLQLEPCSLVRLGRWLDDPGGSFRNPRIPAAELRSHLRCVLTELDTSQAQ